MKKILTVLLAGGAFLLLLVRVYPPLAFVSALLLVVVMLILGASEVVGLVQKRRQQQQDKDEVADEMKERMQNCHRQIEKLEQEVKDIRQHVQQLQQYIQTTDGLSAAVLQDTRRLIVAFEKELQLRSSKITFFRTAARRLSSLLRNHRLQREIVRKKEELEAFRDSNYDDIAAMEEMRYNLERDQTYLQTIENLERRVEDSEEPAEAERLVQELEEMTRQVNRG